MPCGITESIAETVTSRWKKLSLIFDIGSWKLPKIQVAIVATSNTPLNIIIQYI